MKPPERCAIAIVGLACRLPGDVRSPAAFWKVLEEERCVVGPMPPERWRWPAHVQPDTTHRGIDHGGFMDDIAQFDPLFFQIAPLEAKLIDPQQRLLLELSWHCIEDAGLAADQLRGSNTGVFVGATGSDYATLGVQLGLLADRHAAFGVTALATLPNRISYFMDFRGPSWVVDTACSSSLVAVHHAVRSLQRGECERALVAGVHVMCHPANAVAYYDAGMLSPDGRCFAFDARANGYVRSEGVVVMLLAPLALAQARGDHIHAVIKGSAVSHGGKSWGLTVPSADAQASLVRDALADADLAPAALTYIETHGTGTQLGDPIEIGGLKAVFAESSQRHSCALGSSKSNVGHLEAAAGLVGLLKTILCMQQRRIVGQAEFRELSPRINLTGLPLHIATKTTGWDPDPVHGLRRAGVSSFGASGTNAHVIVEEAPVAREYRAGTSSGPALICLSARTDTALAALLRAFGERLDQPGIADDLQRLSHHLLTRRQHFGVRAAWLVDDADDLRRQWQSTERAPTFCLQPEALDATQLAALMSAASRDANVQERRQQLQRIGAAFMAGAEATWTTLFRTAWPPVSGLPGYPFQTKRCWLPEAEQQSSPRRAGTETETTIGRRFDAALRALSTER